MLPKSCPCAVDKLRIRAASDEHTDNIHCVKSSGNALTARKRRQGLLPLLGDAWVEQLQQRVWRVGHPMAELACEVGPRGARRPRATWASLLRLPPTRVLDVGAPSAAAARDTAANESGGTGEARGAGCPPAVLLCTSKRPPGR